MRCERAQKLIAVRVENESAERENRPLRDHLRTCVGCQIFAAEMTEIEREFEFLAPPNFSAEFFQTIRNNVRREIAAEPTRGAFLSDILPRRAAFAAALILFMTLGGSALLFLRPNRIAQNLSTHEMTKTNLTSGLPPIEVVANHPAANGEKPARLNGNRGEQTKTSIARAKMPRRIYSSSPVRQDSVIGVATHEKKNELAAWQTTKAEKLLRLDLQTSDPNVRIIWFAPVTSQ